MKRTMQIMFEVGDQVWLKPAAAKAAGVKFGPHLVVAVSPPRSDCFWILLEGIPDGFVRSCFEGWEEDL